MTEIEVKILAINRAEVETKLIKMGAKKIFDDLIEGGLYDFPDKSLEKKKAALRLRREGREVTLTYKQHHLDERAEGKSKVKTADEYEVKVSSYEETKAIIEALGFILAIPFKKTRVTYQLGEVHFAIDNYQGEMAKVPEFLEIEADSEKLVFEAVEKLGFERKDCVSWGLKGLVDHYMGKKEAEKYGF